MAQRLFDLSLAVARELEKGGLHEGATTVGGAGTDLTLTEAANPLTAGVLVGGTVWIRTGVRAGQSRVIATHVAGGIITWAPALTGNLTIGDQYTVFGPDFRRDVLWRAVNTALGNLPPFATYNIATLTLVDTEEYDLPTGVENVKTVEIAKQLTGANRRYSLHTGWIPIVIPGAIPTPAIRFLRNVPQTAGYIIRLGYNTIHRELVADTDEINTGVSPTRLIYEALAEAWLKRIRSRDSLAIDEQAQMMYNRAVGMAKLMPEHRIATLPDPILFVGVGQRGAGVINPDLV